MYRKLWPFWCLIYLVFPFQSNFTRHYCCSLIFVEGILLGWRLAKFPILVDISRYSVFILVSRTFSTWTSFWSLVGFKTIFMTIMMFAGCSLLFRYLITSIQRNKYIWNMGDFCRCGWLVLLLRLIMWKLDYIYYLFFASFNSFLQCFARLMCFFSN